VHLRMIAITEGVVSSGGCIVHTILQMLYDDCFQCCGFVDAGVTFTQSSFDIKLCLLCMGEGKVKEHYGYREMQVAHCPSPQLILQYAHMFWCQTVYETHNVFVSLGFAQISKTNQMGMTRCVLLGSCDKFVELIHEF